MENVYYLKLIVREHIFEIVKNILTVTISIVNYLNVSILWGDLKEGPMKNRIGLKLLWLQTMEVERERKRESTHVELCTSRWWSWGIRKRSTNDAIWITNEEKHCNFYCSSILILQRIKVNKRMDRNNDCNQTTWLL